MIEREPTVLLVEDDAMVQGWLKLALEGEGFRIVGIAQSSAEALELATRRAPDLILVDYRLPDGAGTELVRELRRRGNDTLAVMMTANAERGFNEAARDAGAQGTVLKTGLIDELTGAIRKVLQGARAFDVRHPKRPPGAGSLSPREREILRAVAAGKTNKEIAGELGVGDETVKTLLARAFAKLGVKRRAEAVSEAHNRGLL